MSHTLADIKKEFLHSHQDPCIFGSTCIFYDDTGVYFILEKADYWENRTQIGFSGIGGKIENDESPYDAVRREIKEEIGLEKYDLMKRNTTFFIDQDENITQINLDDMHPKPVAISEFQNTGKPGNPNADGKWNLMLFVYVAKIEGQINVAHTEKMSGIIHVPFDELDILEKGYSFPHDKISINVNPHGDSLPQKWRGVPKFSARTFQRIYRKLNL